MKRQSMVDFIGWVPEMLLMPFAWLHAVLDEEPEEDAVLHSWHQWCLPLSILIFIGFDAFPALSEQQCSWIEAHKIIKSKVCKSHPLVPQEMMDIHDKGGGYYIAVSLLRLNTFGQIIAHPLTIIVNGGIMLHTTVATNDKPSMKWNRSIHSHWSSQLQMCAILASIGNLLLQSKNRWSLTIFLTFANCPWTLHWCEDGFHAWASSTKFINLPTSILCWTFLGRAATVLLLMDDLEVTEVFKEGS